MKLGAFNINYLNGGITQMDGEAIFGVVLNHYGLNDMLLMRKPSSKFNLSNFNSNRDKNILIDAGIGNHKLTDKQLKIMVSRMKVKYMMN